MGNKLSLILILILVVSLGAGCSMYGRSEVVKINCCGGDVKEFSLVDYSYLAKNEGVYLVNRTTGTQNYFSYDEFYNIEW
ncbi:MAG: hypothetical protein M1409_05230 [Actinobacteria bacterium]|nr:hypothetical protein [Actinomycetota bacterium]